MRVANSILKSNAMFPFFQPSRLFMDAKLISYYRFLLRKSQYLHLCPPLPPPSAILGIQEGRGGGLPATSNQPQTDPAICF